MITKINLYFFWVKSILCHRFDFAMNISQFVEFISFRNREMFVIIFHIYYASIEEFSLWILRKRNSSILEHTDDMSTLSYDDRANYNILKWNRRKIMTKQFSMIWISAIYPQISLVYKHLINKGFECLVGLPYPNLYSHLNSWWHFYVFL